MIEALIDYIMKKGYKVRVSPGYLTIWKDVGEQRLSLSWGITKAGLRVMDWDTLKYTADCQLRKLAEAEKAGPPREEAIEQA